MKLVASSVVISFFFISCNSKTSKTPENIFAVTKDQDTGADIIDIDREDVKVIYRGNPGGFFVNLSIPGAYTEMYEKSSTSIVTTKYLEGKGWVTDNDGDGIWDEISSAKHGTVKLPLKKYIEDLLEENEGSGENLE